MRCRSVVAMFVASLALLMPVLSGSTAFAQAQTEKRSVKLLGLSVEGNKTADGNLIRLSSGLTVGNQITSDDIQNAIRQLWSLDIFSDVQILLDREVAEGVFLSIKVSEYPRLERVEIEGNKKLKREEIDSKLNFYRGQVVSQRALQRARKKLKDAYKEKGFLLAKVDMDVRSADSSDRVVVRVVIDEGKKVQIKKISFYGNVAFDDGKLRKQMKGTKEDRWWRGADFDRKKYEEDLEKVVEFYHNHGYRDAEVLRDSLYYGSAGDDMYIAIWVHEGNQYRFGTISWEGNKVYTEEELARLLDFKEGDIYDRSKLNKAVFEKIGGLYYDNGYIYASISPKERPVGEDRVEIHFVVMENDQAHIHKIHITGNTKTKEKVIRRELRIRPGEVFNRDLLIRSQREVYMLNYFANVEPKVAPVDEKQVDVEFKVEEKSTDTANMSAGWSERDKMIGSIGVSMNNLFGNGQRLSFDWNFGRSFRSFMISFTEPWLFDTPTLAGFSFYDTRRDPLYIGYRQRSRGGSLRVGRRFRWPDNYFRGDWIFAVDQTQLSDFLPILLEANPYFRRYEEMGPLTSRSISQIISRNSLDHPEFPRRGSQVTLQTQVAGGPLGGNVGYHKHQFSSDWFLPAFWQLILHLGLEAGYMDGFAKDSRIPYLDLFFIGGEGMSRSTPLRGYQDPLAGYSTAMGDRVLLKYTAELRLPVVPNPTVFGLIFAEAGNTWPTMTRTDPTDLRRSVGVGARVYMPMIGILGFDYAYGFDNIDARTGERRGKWVPHFVFGRGF